MWRKITNLLGKDPDKQQKAVVVQRATSYYQPYAVEYHPFIVHYKYASLADHCRFLWQQKEIYKCIETKIQEMIDRAKLKTCSDYLKHDASKISQGMEKDLTFYKDYLPASIHYKKHYVTKNYLGYLKDLSCECELLGNYLALLGLNYYGGKYAFIPALREISSKAEFKDMHEKMQYKTHKSLPALGASAYPLVDRPQGLPAMNDLIKNWIHGTATPEQIQKEYMPKIFIGYYRAIFHLKLLCDAMHIISSSQELKYKPDNFKSERNIAKESAMLVALEHQCTYGKYKDLFKGKGLKVCGFDDEKYAWKKLGCSYEEPEAIKPADMLKKGYLLLSVTAKKHQLQAEWISNGTKFHMQFGKLVPKEFKKIEQELQHIDRLSESLAARFSVSNR